MLEQLHIWYRQRGNLTLPPCCSDWLLVLSIIKLQNSLVQYLGDILPQDLCSLLAKPMVLGYVFQCADQ